MDFSCPVAKAGNRGLAVEVIKTSNTHWHIQLSTRDDKFQRGYTYVLTFWAKANASCTECYWAGVSTTNFVWKALVRPSLTTNWKKVTLTWKAENRGSFMFQFNLGTSRVGTYYFDDLVVTTDAPPVNQISPTAIPQSPILPQQQSPPPPRKPSPVPSPNKSPTAVPSPPPSKATVFQSGFEPTELSTKFWLEGDWRASHALLLRQNLST